MTTANHQNEAREIIDELDCRILEDFQPTLSHDVAEWLTQRLTTALSARDREIREVLEGLSCEFYDKGRNIGKCWCGPDETSLAHTPACLAARALWKRVQINLKEDDNAG